MTGPTPQAVHVTVRLSEADLKAVDERAASDRRTRSNWISALISRAINDEIAIKVGDQWVVWK